MTQQSTWFRPLSEDPTIPTMPKIQIDLPAPKPRPDPRDVAEIEDQILRLAFDRAMRTIRRRTIVIYLTTGVMIGFLSHLVLDEIYAVDFNGVRLRLNQFAGSALKLASPSWVATSVCYGLLVGLGFLAYLDYLETVGR